MSLLELHTRSLELAAAVVDTVQPEQLVLPTPCAGWSLRHLVEHMVGLHRGFAAAAAGAGPDPALWHGVPVHGVPVHGDPVHGDPGGAFRHSAARLTAAFALAAAAPRPAPLRLPEVRDGAPVPFERAVGFHLLDTLVHAWDVAVALGPPDRLVAAVEGEPPLAEALLAVAGAVPAAAPDRAPGRAFAAVRAVDGEAGPFGRALALLGRDTAWAVAAR
ncbi:TIGR03086 family metal-binding protein [Kitasatospora sp. NPDC001527]|uniref:TIGR03086 family metal-binding protein n=1 Tax=Kitasatospora sp. NPDC001527 TaxID=3154519 RepID=UPI003327268F